MKDEDRDFERVLRASDPDQVPAVQHDRGRMNPRYLFIDSDSDFGRVFYHDLLMEQQEQG